MRKEEDSFTLNVFKYPVSGSFRYPATWKNILPGFFKKIKYAYQRVTKGYCDFDLYSPKTFYAKLISESMKDFSKKTHSSPINIAFEDWQNIVTEISIAFNKYLENYYIRYGVDPNSAKKAFTAYEKIVRNKLSDVDFSSDESQEKAVQSLLLDYSREMFQDTSLKRGLALLSKYYDELWD